MAVATPLKVASSAWDTNVPAAHIIPAPGRVLAARLPAEETIGEIELSTGARRENVLCRVIAAGAGCDTLPGEVIVVHRDEGLETFALDEVGTPQQYTMILEEQILAVYREDTGELRAVGDHVLLEPEAHVTVSSAGLVIPKSAKLPSQIFRVHSNGCASPEHAWIAPGSRIVLMRFSGAELTLLGREWNAARPDECIGLIAESSVAGS